MGAPDGLARLGLLVAHLRQVLFHELALLRRVIGAVVMVADALAHVVHGRGRHRLDAAVAARRRDGHAGQPADADGAHLLRVDEFQVRHEIHRRVVILGEDFRRAHIAPRAAALAGHGRIESHGHISVLCHFLRVEAGGLLLDGAEGSRDDNGLVLFLDVKPLRQIEMPGDLEAVAVLEAHILRFDGLVHAEHAGIVVQIADGGLFHLRGSDQRPGRRRGMNRARASESKRPDHHGGQNEHGFFLRHFHNKNSPFRKLINIFISLMSSL